MRSNVSLTVLALALLLLQGCGGMGSKAGGQGPSTDDLGKIQVGVTTAGDVKTLLGPPIIVARFDRMDRDVWEYRRYNDPMDEHHIAVQFSPDGIVREVVVVKDYTREPCGN